MLKPFGHEIWTAEGSNVVAALGFHYPTRMVVIRWAAIFGVLQPSRSRRVRMKTLAPTSSSSSGKS